MEEHSLKRSDAFESLLAPVDVGEFFDRYWEQETLLVRGSLTRLPFTFTRSDYFASLRECRVAKAAFLSESGEHKDVRIDPTRAEEGFERGYSICGSEIELGSQTLRSYLHGLEASLRHLGNFTMNGYLSPGDKGFGLHFDNHSVWVVQLEGSKHWSYSAGAAVPFPLSNTVLRADASSLELPWYHVERPDESKFLEATLEPGDMLYLPAGAWHRTRAGGYSLSVTLAQSMTPATHFVHDVMRHVHLSSLEGRHYLPVVPVSGGGTESAREEILPIFEDCLALMRETLEHWTPEELYQVWRARIASRRSIPVPGDASGRPNTVPWEG